MAARYAVLVEKGAGVDLYGALAVACAAGTDASRRRGVRTELTEARETRDNDSFTVLLNDSAP